MFGMRFRERFLEKYQKMHLYGENLQIQKGLKNTSLLIFLFRHYFIQIIVQKIKIMKKNSGFLKSFVDLPILKVFWSACTIFAQ